MTKPKIAMIIKDEGEVDAVYSLTSFSKGEIKKALADYDDEYLDYGEDFNEIVDDIFEDKPLCEEDAFVDDEREIFFIKQHSTIEKYMI